MPLFDVAVIQKPSKKEVEENGASESLILGPLSVIAKDAQSAAIKAIGKYDPSARQPGQPVFDLDKCEVLVRPFV